MKKNFRIFMILLSLLLISGCNNIKHEHVKGSWTIIEEANCIKEGLKVKYCLICDEEISRKIIEKKEHKNVDGKCIECQLIHIHKESDWQIVEEATCTNDGREEKHCIECKEVLATKIINKLFHNYVDGACSCGKRDPNYQNDGPSEGLEFRLNASKSSYVVTGIGTCADDNIVIPNTYNGLPVTSIGSKAFSWCTGLTSVEIPSSITSIGNSAFFNCTRLEIIEIPNSVTNIGAFAFSSTKVKNIIIPSSVTIINNNLFEYCTKLESIVIPSSIRSIGERAFSDCTSLKEVRFEENSKLVSIIDYAFYNCTSLESIELPSSVTSIGYSAFRSCTSLESIELSSSVTSIGYSAFRSCTSLKSIKIPNSITSIGNSVFYSCTSLENIELSKSVTIIEDRALYECTSLKNVYYNGTIEDWCKIQFGYSDSNPMYYANNFYMLDENNEYYEVTEIEIPDTITSIGEHQFCGFDNITKLTIPNSITIIEYSEFPGFINLTNLYYNGTIEDWCNIKIINHYLSNPMYYTKHLYMIDENNEYYEVTEIEIPDTITSIGDHQFCGLDALTKIIIPNSVTKIGQYVLLDCKSLESITLPFVGSTLNGTKNTHFGYIFGASSYSNSSYVPKSLKEVIITGGTSIGERAFYNCTSIESITIPNSVTIIEDRAFEGCTNLTNVYYNGTIEDWCKIQFSNATSNPMAYAKHLYMLDENNEYYEVTE